MSLIRSLHTRTPPARTPPARTPPARTLPARILLACALLVLLTSSAATATALAAPVGATLGPEYAPRAACPAPRPGWAECLALAVRPRTARARSHVHAFATRSAASAGLAKASECVRYKASCFTPAQLRDAYFPGEAPDAPAGTTQTIALVDAYNDPGAEADLATYSSEFDLPACTSTNGCFEQVGQSGGAVPFPKTRSELETYAKGTARQRAKAEEAEGWSLEIATDVEMAHAICQNCHILLVEAASPEYSALEAAEDTAAARAEEVSNSWGGPETGSDSPAFDHPGVAVTAATGDDGYLNWDQYETREEEGSPYFEGPDYPASSPHVTAVGGTSLQLSAEGAWQSESPWNGEGAGGSGCSVSLAAPEWQLHVADWSEVGCGSERASADVAAVADPATGVNVYDSIPYPVEEDGAKLSTVLHWLPIGGTSVASPIVAAMFALAGGAHGVAYPAQTLYSHLGSPLLHDVASGGNGECDGVYLSCSGSMDSLSPLSALDCGAGAWICNATVGYDGPTGVGTPDGIAAFEPSAVKGEGGEKEEGGEKGEAKGKGGEEAGKGKEEPPHVEPAPGEGGSKEQSGSPTGTAGATAAGTSSTGGGAPGSPHSSALAAARASVSRLALTARATLALVSGARAGHTISQVAFSYRLSRAASVRAVLALRVRIRAGVRWRVITPTLNFTASAGAHRRSLHGSHALAPGVYRLTLTPLGGLSESLTLRVG